MRGKIGQKSGPLEGRWKESKVDEREIEDGTKLRRKIGPNSGLLEGKWEENMVDERQDGRKVRSVRGKMG